MAVQDLYVLSGYWAPDYAFGDEGVYPISELQGVAPSAIIELFELDLNQLQHGITETYRFHAGSSLNANGELVWAGNSYMRFPVEADGFEYSGNGQLPRPKIRCSNILGTITALLLSLPSGLEGAKFTRIRTLARYLDAVNFPGSVNPYGVPDPSAEFPREIFYVDRKVVETRDVVEFELAAAFDLAGVRAPKRQCISNICQWVYRSAECGYTAPLYFDEDDALETTAAADVCGKRLSSCQVRFSSYTRTGSVTSGSTTITLTPPTSLSAGTPITGHGIPAGTVTVGTVLDGTTFTLSQAANANTTATKTGTVQSNRTSIIVSDVVGLTLGMAVSGPYIPAGTTITGIAGNTVSLSQPAPINFQVAFTRPNINLVHVTGQTAYSHLYVINTAGISVGMAVTGPGLPSDLSARVTGLTTISFLGVAIVSYAVARPANGTYTFYASTAYASTTYIFTGSTTYAIRGASDSLPFGSFPGVGTYYA